MKVDPWPYIYQISGYTGYKCEGCLEQWFVDADKLQLMSLVLH